MLIKRKCTVCNLIIPEGRLKALPNARTCVEHSTASPYGMRTVAYGTNADNAQQEFEIIRDAELARKIHEYEKISQKVSSLDSED